MAKRPIRAAVPKVDLRKVRSNPMNLPFYIIFAVLVFGISILGMVVPRLIARGKHRAIVNRSSAENSMETNGRSAATSASEPPLLRFPPIPAVTRRTAANRVGVSLRPDDPNTSDTGRRRSNRAVERIDRLPRYKRAIAWSEILSKPVSER